VGTNTAIEIVRSAATEFFDLTFVFAMTQVTSCMTRIA